MYCDEIKENANGENGRMIENVMIAKILVTVLYTLIVFILGIVCGQHSVWMHLRKKGQVIIDEWFYTAVKVTEE